MWPNTYFYSSKIFKIDNLKQNNDNVFRVYNVHRCKMYENHLCVCVCVYTQSERETDRESEGQRDRERERCMTCLHILESNPLLVVSFANIFSDYEGGHSSCS